MTAAKELVTDNRPLRLRLDLPGGFNDDMLLPQRVFGSESICGGIEYRVLCVSANAQLPLKKMIAVAAQLDFVTDRGDLRSVCGIVTQASSGDSDGGLASYQLVLRDALAILEKRTNTRVFRSMDEVEIVQRILDEWRQKSPVLGICFNHEKDEAFDLRTYPKREFTMQHNESDAAFIRRLLKRRGIGWYIRAGEMMHTLVLFNNADSLRQNAAGTIRYHRDAATEERDTITAWSAVRSLQPGTVTRHSWDYMNPQGRDFMLVSTNSSNNQGVNGNELAATLDDYQILPPHAGDDNEDLFNLGQLRMKRHDYESKCFHGEGSVRDLCAGEYFTLAEHPEVDQHDPAERDFIVTDLQVTAQNNLPKALATRVERLFARSRWMHGASDVQMQRDVADKVASGPLRMHIQFTAVRRGVTIVPAFDPRVDVPQAQMQSAIVVGPEGEEVHCDQLGRVKIRFPGTRPEDHEEAAGAGASDTTTDSAWVRVASNWAGNGPGAQQQCGTIGLPRIGAEVLISFLGGDPDKPVIVSQLFNRSAEPTALSRTDELPHSRYLSGIRSREIQGSRGSQLRFDDTAGEISAQLASDHAQSQLNLGFLTSPRVHGIGTPRGEGVELISAESVAIRGSNGILLSTQATTGDQLERDDLIGLADVLNSIAEQLASVAQTHSSDETEGPYLSELIERLRNWKAGANQAILSAHAAQGILCTSEKNIFIGTQLKLDAISAGDANISAGKNLFVRAMKGISVFTHAVGMRLVAASGNVLIQTHRGDINLTATGRICITAGQGLELQSPEIKLVSKGAQVNYGGGAITQQSKGDHTIKAGKFLHTSGGDGDVGEVNFPSTSIETDERVILYHSQTGEPVKGRRYKLTLPDGRKIEGTTDEQGRTALATAQEFGDVEVLIYPENA
ncbi:type VI secretion system tip protein VgrG [Duganella sp. FT134W]|uniref:Type VI secretion system tip protein VgrG n=2 Tax=Duganella margarita TaxID=2692170 RepID=A0A7X4H5D1_9BURK|nr:type VI secretion system Vgr family protein [Duganella margarita]MYM75583.1 type VI secretion system tip protein VgrG [Duganella margarita]